MFSSFFLTKAPHISIDNVGIGQSIVMFPNFNKILMAVVSYL